jgi:uncharacterized LabA/DUF88 family protein
MKNLAFIDGQNLHMGVSENEWKIDHKKFRIYLEENYQIKEAYYFLGFLLKSEEKLYKNLEEAGFILCLKEHSKRLSSKKKGNVDVDIVFEIMKIIAEKEEFDGIMLVSGDGDYKKLIDYLIEKKKINKILFPNKKASTLYKQLSSEYFDYIDNIRSYIEYKNEKGS